MKNFLKFLVIIIIIAAIVLLCKNYLKTEENTVQVSSENTEGNEVVEENIDNKVENENTQTTPEETSKPEKNIYESDTDIGTTNKKQEAIDKVKEVWGEDNTVTYRCDSVTNDGEYIIAVVSTETMTVKNYFRVNLEKNTVEVDY